jgi:hypothetical protein
MEISQVTDELKELTYIPEQKQIFVSVKEESSVILAFFPPAATHNSLINTQSL